MSIEPVPYPEVHEPNTKKKLQSAIQFAMDRKSEGLAGLIMWLPGDVKVDASYNHPVVILSPSISVDSTVEILGMTSFHGQDLATKFSTSRIAMKKRARYLPIEPTPPHPDTPERNVMLKVLPYNPRTYSYVDGSVKSRKSVLFSVLEEYLPHGFDYGVYNPRFYLDKDSYQKLAAFAGFSTVGLLYAPVDPEVEEDLTEQLAAKDEPQSPFLPNHNADILLPVMNHQAQSEHETTQGSGVTEPPVPTHNQPTSPTPSASLDLEQISFNTAHLKRKWAFDNGARHVYGLSGPLNLSKTARNHIRLAIACVSMLAAGRAFSMSTVGREVLKETVAGVKAMMLAGASKKLVVTATGALARMAWAVVRHSGRNWGRYTIASLSACVFQVYDERYPGGRGFKLDQILMLVWDVACWRIME